MASEMTETESNKSRWNPWPVSIIAFFATGMLSFAAFIWFCTRHPAELVAADYYEQELRYQGQIDRIQNTQQHGNAAAVTYDPATQSILISLPSTVSRAEATGQVQLYRPSAVKLDRRFRLELDTNGVQRIDAARLSPGLWKVRVSWTLGKENYFIDQRVVVPSRTS